MFSTPARSPDVALDVPRSYPFYSRLTPGTLKISPVAVTIELDFGQYPTGVRTHLERSLRVGYAVSTTGQAALTHWLICEALGAPTLVVPPDASIRRKRPLPRPFLFPVASVGIGNTLAEHLSNLAKLFASRNPGQRARVFLAQRLYRYMTTHDRERSTSGSLYSYVSIYCSDVIPAMRSDFLLKQARADTVLRDKLADVKAFSCYVSDGRIVHLRFGSGKFSGKLPDYPEGVNYR